MTEENIETLDTKKAEEKKRLYKLSLAALGVIYGDIGTSPLYAIRESFHPIYGLEHSHDNVIGILSLFFWTLTLVVTVKYIVFVMRADNKGEGGMLSLLSLILSTEKKGTAFKGLKILIILGLFGTSLLVSDGIITPAISVLSAVEGLGVSSSSFDKYIIPITVIILVLLFLFQKRGTACIGSIFGPLMMLWFLTIGILGLIWICRAPQILSAINPYYAISFFVKNQFKGFFVLGAVILCITGGEALYADMGHFGHKPIKRAWFAVVFPALLLNYFGQGASILLYPEAAVENPFYFLARGFMHYPMVIIATMATIIASQALISGSFSLAQQAIQLGYLPRLNIIHTSHEIHGQIYIPTVNKFLMFFCIGLVFAFKRSSALAAAYGIAVMGTMTITTILIFNVAIRKWEWKLRNAVIMLVCFLMIDLPFLLANSNKITDGGWFPIAIGSLIFTIMTTWKRGRAELSAYFSNKYIPLDLFLNDLATFEEKPLRARGIAVFMTSNPSGVPPILLHYLKHTKTLHEKVILLSIINQKEPKVPHNEKVEIKELQHGFYQIIAKYGFMETPNIPEILEMCEKKGVKLPLFDTTFFLGRESLLITGPSKMARWRKSLFAILSRNARPATAFFGIPPNRVVELGMQIEL